MNAVVSLLEGLTLWHWVGVGIVLLTLEVAVGTFDLLWVAMAAFVTALFSAVAPGTMGDWEGQLVCFGVVAVAFVMMGRTVFKGLRRAPSTHPNLNIGRTTAMIGQHGEAMTTFEGGEGRVKVGDTVWAAQSDGPMITAGAGVIVTGADGTTLKIRLA